MVLQTIHCPLSAESPVAELVGTIISGGLTLVKRTLIALAILFYGVSFFLFNSFYREAEETAITSLNDEQKIHLKLAARGIEDFFTTWTRNLNTLSKIDAIIDNNPAGDNYLKLFYEANHDQIRSITRLDERGVMLFNFPSSGSAGTDISDQKHVKELLREHRPVISDVFMAIEGFHSIAIHVPVFSGTVFKGSIGILIDFEGFTKRYFEEIKIGETGYAWVISRDGTLLYSPVHGDIGKPVLENIKAYPSLITMVNDMLRGHEGTSTYTYDRIGERKVGQTRKYAVYMPVRIGDTFWSMAVASAEQDVLSSLISLRKKLGLVVSVLFILGMVFASLGVKEWFIFKEEEKRRMVEKQLEGRLRFETLLSSISTRFNKSSVDQLDDDIKAAQREICESLGLDISALWQFSQDQPTNLFLTHYYVPPDFPVEVPQTLKADESFPWCLEKMMKKEMILLRRLSEAPAGAPDVDGWKFFGIRSVVTYPLYAGDGQVFGALNFNTVKKEQAWPEELVNMLQMVSEIFANALKRKLIVSDLRESEARLRDITFSMADWVWEVDEKGVYTYSSSKVEELFGCVIGKTPFDFMLPEEAARVSAIFSRAAAEKAPIRDLESWNLRKDGERICLLTNGVPILDKGGNLKGYRGVDKDITEHRRAVGALQASEARFRALAESALVGIYVLQDGNYAYVNPAMARVFGYSVAEMTGMSPREIVQPCDHGMVKDNIQRRITGEVQAIQYEVRGRHKNGSTRDVEVYGTRIEMNSRPALVGTLIDITERKRADEALRISEERYRGVVETQSDMICRFLPDTTLLFVNEAYMRYYGKSREDLVGKQFLLDVPVELREEILLHFASFESGDPIRTSQRELVLQDGSRRWQEWTDHAFFNQNGQVAGFQAVGRDITERKKSEEALRASESALRNSQKDIRKLAGRLIYAQEEELRRLSRELHDDLTQRLAVLAIDAGKLELDLGKMPEACPEVSHKISQMKDQLIRVSEDVHAISRQLHPTILDDLGLVRAIESECAAVMRRENIDIIFNKEAVPSEISKDVALCIYRVFQEGLKNVITHSGSAKCEIFLEGVDNTICLSVSDPGVGFEPDEVRNKAGLGLSSMRERVQLVQGYFSIKSGPGQGTIVRIVAPLKAGVL